MRPFAVVFASLHLTIAYAVLLFVIPFTLLFDIIVDLSKGENKRFSQDIAIIPEAFEHVMEHVKKEWNI